MPTYTLTPLTTVEATVPAEATRWQSEIRHLGARVKILVTKNKQKPEELHTHFNKKEWTLGFKDFDFSEI